jgi:hypothetical protein
MALPGVIRGVGGAPGVVGYPSGITTSVFNELNYVIPEYRPKLVSKYGNDSWVLMSEMVGASVVEEVSTTTNTFSHFERGRIYGVGIINANVAASSGSTISITLKSPDSYNDGATGTQSPFVNGQTVKVRSSGRKARIQNINRTSAGAFTADLVPLGSYSLGTGTTTTLNSGDAIETFGPNQLAGESSSAAGTVKPKLYRYDNTCTVIRAGVKSSDLAAMNKTQVDMGGSNYEPFLAIKVMNKQMLMSIEDAVIEGVPDDNISGSTGTIGVMPELESRGIETNYIKRDFQISDFQTLTRLIDFNGGPDTYVGIQDIYQRQDINNLLFGKYTNGMINYGSAGLTGDTAVGYGFRSFATDTYSFHFHRFKGFSPEATHGYTPTQGNYRGDQGVFIPQGQVTDAKMNVERPFFQFVYQKSPDFSEKIYSWSLGYTQATKTEEASNNYHQISYVGSRVVCAEQFALLKGKSLS